MEIKAIPDEDREIMTHEEVKAHWLGLGYTHVLTLAGPMPIGQWLEKRPHGPDPENYRFELREDNSAVDGAEEPKFAGFISRFYRGVWTPVVIEVHDMAASF